MASLLVRAMPHVAYIMNQLSGPSNHGRWRLMARASRPSPSAFRTAMVSEPVQVKHRLQELQDTLMLFAAGRTLICTYDSGDWRTQTAD